MLQESALQCRRADLRGLQQTCVDRLKAIYERLEWILKSVQIVWASDPASVVHDYRALNEHLSMIERSGVFALIHSADNDPFLSNLTQQICEDICYPLQIPIVSETSPSHFTIDEDFNVLYVPPLENRFLLHLPDLYHELGHPILFDDNLKLPSLKPVKVEYALAIFDRIQNLEERIVDSERREGPEMTRRRMSAFLDLWVTSWMREFYCDLFATYCLGPAYAWSHCHLCLKLSSNPFDTPNFEKTTHPSDASRMNVILCGLKALGFKQECDQITKIWSDQIQLGGYSENMIHKQCYPEDALAGIARGAIDAFENVGLKAARPDKLSGVALCLNQAWQSFWSDPGGFSDWETVAIAHLQTVLSGHKT